MQELIRHSCDILKSIKIDLGNSFRTFFYVSLNANSDLSDSVESAVALLIAVRLVSANS